MPYRKFLCYNVIGGIAWVAGFALAGFFFGNIPVVKQQLGVVILAIIIISVVPAVIGFLGATGAKPCNKPTLGVHYRDICVDSRRSVQRVEFFCLVRKGRRTLL